MKRKTAFFCLALPLMVCTAAAAAASQPASMPPDPSLSVDDLPSGGRIRISNQSNVGITLYYDYVSSFGNLQMFFVRFRDRTGALIPVTEAPDGWFTPKVHYASLQWPARRRLVVPANGTIELERDVSSMANWTYWERPINGPCEVQFKLFGYLDARSSRSVEAVSQWSPGPCPS